MTESHTWTGRVRKPWWKKINPIWWFMNDDNQTVEQADWYHPEWPHWRRWLVWNIFRNPMQNFSSFVIGVQDKNYTVTGKAPVLTTQRNDLNPPEYGYQWCYSHGGELWIPRPFISYSGKHVVWYIGWQPNGFARIKINLS